MWQAETIEILRVFIDDMDDENPTYSDEKLERVLLVAAFNINTSVDFVNDYTVDIQTSTLTPDPTDPDTTDDAFVNLMCLKAACIIDRGRAITASEQAVSIKEFSTNVNLSTVAAAKQKLLEKGGWCPVFEEELVKYQLSANGVVGAAVLGPFRTTVGYPNVSRYDSSYYYDY